MPWLVFRKRSPGGVRTSWTCPHQSYDELLHQLQANHERKQTLKCYHCPVCSCGSPGFINSAWVKKNPTRHPSVFYSRDPRLSWFSDLTATLWWSLLSRRMMRRGSCSSLTPHLTKRALHLVSFMHQHNTCWEKAWGGQIYKQNLKTSAEVIETS